MTIYRDDPQAQAQENPSYDTLGLKLTVMIIARPAERYDLRKLEWYGSHRSVREHIEKSYTGMRSGTHQMLVADLNNYPVGLVCLQYRANDPQMADGHTRGYLYAFRVMPNLQSMGIGTLLLNAAEQHLLDKGMSVITLQVAKDNLRGQQLYTRQGYRSFGSKVNIWHHNRNGEIKEVREPCWAMEKTLAPLS
jgi:ribosomal protein S18 acetylase RimI-like enzyme